MSIAAARNLPDDATATIEGVLTTNLGALESGRVGFLEDETAGIALYLDAALTTSIPAGTRIEVQGTLDSRFALRTLRIAGADVVVRGPSSLPTPVAISTGDAGEGVEGRRVSLEGVVIEAPSSLSDGLGLMVDDGSGPVRVIVGPDALAGASPTTGMHVTATGPLGQRDSSGTGLAGYRLHATLPGEIVVAPASTPTPTPTMAPTPTPRATATVAPTDTPGSTSTPVPTATPMPTPTPLATATPQPTETPVPTLGPTPTPTAAALTVSQARIVPEGDIATVRGVVIAEAGRLGTPPLLAIGDITGGLPVKLVDGMVAPPRGSLVLVRGAIAAPYGQTEVRLVAGGLSLLGTASLPAPIVIDAGGAGEASEGRLATIMGTITASAAKATSGDLAFTIEGRDGVALRIVGDASAGLDASALKKGAEVTLTGIVGQRASRKGALDGYRLWVRDRSDVIIRSAAATAAPRSTSTPRPGSAATSPRLAIAAAVKRQGDRVTIDGVITVERSLLDSSGRRTIVEDASGAIELYLAEADTAIATGVRVRATGTVGTAWNAPRLRVDAITVLGRATPVVHELRGVPTASGEWRLVRLRGTLDEVHKDGDAWTAELVSGSRRVPVRGVDGSGIAAPTAAEGRQATIVGIVKRAFPTATDQRFAVLPRRPADVALGAAMPSSSAPPSPSGGQSATGAPIPSSAGSLRAEAASVRDVAIVDLAAHLGEPVRIGGLVTVAEAEGVLIDDGTASATIVPEGAAADLATLFQPGDALNASGVPEARDGAIVLVVADPADIVLLGDLGGEDEASADPSAQLRAAGVPAGDDPMTPAGTRREPLLAALLALVLAGGMAAAVVARRVLLVRRRTRARIQARIAEFAGRSTEATAPH